MQGTYDCDVAVVGGGPVGLARAQAGFRCAQFDSVALERVRIHTYTCTLLVGRGAVRVSFAKESGLSCPRGAFPGPGANDATAGLSAHRSALPAAFPGQDVPVDRLTVGLRLTVVGTTPDLPRSSLFGPGWGTVCGGPARNRARVNRYDRLPLTNCHWGSWVRRSVGRSSRSFRYSRDGRIRVSNRLAVARCVWYGFVRGHWLHGQIWSVVSGRAINSGIGRGKA